MWEGGCAPFHAAYSAETYCLIYVLFLTVRFTLWTNKGNAIISATGTATFYLKKSVGGGKLFLGWENSRATPPLYEALMCEYRV